MSRQTTSRLSLLRAPVNFTATGDNTLVAAVAGTSVRVHGIFFVVSAATNLTFKRGSTALTGAMPMTANGSFVLDPNEEPWMLTLDGEAFVLSQSGTAQVSGQIAYTQHTTNA